MDHERFRVPDRVFWILAVAVNIFTWASLAYVYSSLPNRLPTHFGITGQADAYAAKSWFTVFLPALVQSAITALMVWIYRYPQYSSIPSSLALGLFPEPWRSRITFLLRHLIVMLTVIMNLIFAYIALAIISDSATTTTAVNGWAIAGLVGLLLVLTVVYTVWLARLAQQGIAAARRGTT